MVDSQLSDVAHVIQLSVAPVFLLTSVGTILAVLSTRLARIVDRARAIGDRAAALPPAHQSAIRDELRLLARRRRLVNIAFVAGVCAALFVCVLIACAFVGTLLSINLGTLLALLFISAMCAFVVTLLTFLREVLLAVSNVRVEPE
jgi:hypothetical protein